MTAVWHPACRSQTLEEQLKKLVHIVDCVCADVQRAQNFYNKLFYRWISPLVGTACSQLCASFTVGLTRLHLCLLSQCSESGFPQHIIQAVGETGTKLKITWKGVIPKKCSWHSSFNLQVADDINVAMERVCGTLEQESSRLTQTMGETIFELFVSLKILKGFREFLPLKSVRHNSRDRCLIVWNEGGHKIAIIKKKTCFLLNRDAKMLALTGFHNCFKSPIHKWLQIVHDRSCERIRKAVETDKVRSFCLWVDANKA